MILRKTYSFMDWTKWDKELDESVKDFFMSTHKWPNILLASEATLNRVDFIANQKQQNIRPGEIACTDSKPQPDVNYKSLTGFKAKSYVLEFCLDYDLATQSFSLVYDSNPNGDDGEPLPKEDNVSSVANTRVKKIRVG